MYGDNYDGSTTEQLYLLGSRVDQLEEQVTQLLARLEKLEDVMPPNAIPFSKGGVG